MLAQLSARDNGNVQVILALILLSGLAQEGASPDAKQPAAAAAVSQDYVCPMDPDVRSDKPGSCPRCGMKLVLGIPDTTEFPLDLRVEPAKFHAGDKVRLAFHVLDPKTGKQVRHFQVVHEKFMHMFVVSQDLGFFIHQHPVEGADHVFRYEMNFPKPGMYRVLADFYPEGGSPQLVARTVIVPARAGEDVKLATPKLSTELGVSHASNMDVELVMDPPRPIVGMKTLMFFRLKPAYGLQQYLGAWGHMLAASDDLIDMIHDHPFIADGGPQEQFNMIFPRARIYRVWVQFQRNGVVNTAAFNVPVSELK